jgi:hypothetical protein
VRGTDNSSKSRKKMQKKMHEKNKESSLKSTTLKYYASPNNRPYQNREKDEKNRKLGSSVRGLPPPKKLKEL